MTHQPTQGGLVDYFQRAKDQALAATRGHDSFAAGKRDVIRAAAHCFLVAEAVADVAYWLEEAVEQGQCTPEQARDLMRQMSEANLAMALQLTREVFA
jgi:hypothetical protein